MESYIGFYGATEDNLKSLNQRFIDFRDKDKVFRYHLKSFMRNSIPMFEYKNLPKTITHRRLEYLLQSNGFAVFFDYKGEYYITYAGMGGVPDFNYQPTVAIIANPYLEITTTRKIDWGYPYEVKQQVDGECVVIPNDSLFYGLFPTHTYYATQLTENDLTLNCLLINTRLMNLLVAGDDNAKTSLDEVINELYNGKIATAVDKNWIMESIKSVPFGSTSGSSNIVQLLEERQYIKGSHWNSIGVQSNYNMKRETITSSENILNVDSLLPLTDDMYKLRKEYLDIINNKYGLDISIEFSSSWKKIRDELKIKEELQLKELNTVVHPNGQETKKDGDDNGLEDKKED